MWIDFWKLLSRFIFYRSNSLQETGKIEILIVEPDEINRKNLTLLLDREGYSVSSSVRGAIALEYLKTRYFHVMLTNIHAGDMEGLELMTAARPLQPDMAVIFVTDQATVESAVHAMMAGAFSYVARPFAIDSFLSLVRKATRKTEMSREIRRRGKHIRSSRGIQFIGKNPAIVKLKSDIAEIAQHDSNVLILGETGTGKELVASTIHALSKRADRRFLPINCSALTEELMLNELFGHEKEAFTGASKFRTGLFEAADGGTLLLDEIGEMPVSMQVKLLRVIQEKKIIRVGGTREIPVDVRILAATNRDLRKEVQEGRFRQDLFYRLNVVTLSIPPLRERRDDIPLLIQHFLAKYSSSGQGIKSISQEVLDILMNYDFPGNIRELENIIERAAAMCRDQEIMRHHLPPEFQYSAGSGSLADATVTFKPLREYERDYILTVLKSVNGNKSKAAAILGIDRVSLWRKLKKYEAGAMQA